MIGSLRNLVKYILEGTYVNEKFTIQTQFFTAFISLSLFTAGITFAICIGMLFSLGNQAMTSTSVAVIDVMMESIRSSSDSFASALEQNVLVLAQTMTLQSSLFAKKTFETSPALFRPQNSNNGIPPFVFDALPYYREYKFEGDCLATGSLFDCPDDYGNLRYRSRFPLIPGFINGSTRSSSVYLYESASNAALRSDSDWTAALSAKSYVEDAINAGSYQDEDLEIIYKQGPKTTLMFYLSSKVYQKNVNADADYYNVHRTFPGIPKAQLLPGGVSYDGTKRDWFVNAPEDAYYMYGPYIETFTKLQVLTISSRQNAEKYYNGKTIGFETVSAAVILLGDLQKMIGDITFPYDGFGILANIKSEAIVFKNASYDTYNNESKKFKKWYEMLDGKIVYASGDDGDDVSGGNDYLGRDCFNYVEDDGTEFVGCLKDFFTSTSYGSSYGSDYLVMISFAKKTSALKALVPLEENIQESTSVTTAYTLIVCGIVFAVMILFTIFIVAYMILPLRPLLDISKRIVKETAEPEDSRDFYPILCDAQRIVNERTNEIGILLNEYFNVVCILHNKVTEKKKTPKVSSNVFYLNLQPAEVVSWSSFYAYFRQFRTQDSSKGDTNSSDSIPTGAGTEKEVEFETDMLADIDLSALKKQKNGSKQYFEIEQGGTEVDGGKGRQSAVQSSANSSSDTVIEVADVSIREQTLVQQVQIKYGLTFFIYTFVATLIAGAAAIAIITIVNLDTLGHTWMSSAESKFIDVQIANLRASIGVKSYYVDSFFNQFVLETKIGGNALLSVLGNQFIDDSNVPSNYLRSCSLDSHGPRSQCFESSDYSGYFTPEVLTQSESTVLNSYETQLSSMVDIRLSSFFHKENILSFLQYGSNKTGYTRYIPYKMSDYKYPTSCKIDDLTLSSCYNNYQNSNCASPNHSPSYQPYDPRCRSWFHKTVYNDRVNKSDVLVFPPRISSSGAFVLSLGKYLNSTSTNRAYVFLYNVKADKLSEAINKFKILDNGYLYLLKIQNRNSTSVILHSQLEGTCSDIFCAENFKDRQEMDAFNRSFIYPIAAGRPSSEVSQRYTKQGKDWIIEYDLFECEGEMYIVVATVPISDILKSSDALNDDINIVVDNMITACFFAIFGYLIILVIISSQIVESIKAPLEELTDVCTKITKNELSSRLPSTVKSYDMKVLLESFNDLLVALRFGSESFGRGDLETAKKVFTDALNLFTVTNNRLGIGAAGNNLAAIQASAGNFADAFENYQKAIKNAEDIISDPGMSKESKEKYERVLSDRKGNLALLYMESKQFDKAFEIIETQMKSDKKMGYIRGLVVKQGTLGHFYLKQKEGSSARKAFVSALKFLDKNSSEDALYEKEWSKEEAGSSEQIARYNYAILLEFEKCDPNALVSAFLDGLCRPSFMHLSTVTKVFSSVRSIFERTKDSRLNEVDEICEKYGFNKKATKDASSDTYSAYKRVAFSVDYSGSMSGSKITAATSSLKTMIADFINPSDDIMIVKFNHRVEIVLPLCKKEGHTGEIESAITNMSNPGGSTAFFDSIKTCLDALGGGGDGDWIMSLTDGEDNSSAIKSDGLIKLLQKQPINLIVIGVGNDVQSDVLQQLCKATPKGFYLSSTDNAAGIKESFAKAAKVIQGQLLLEDL